MSERTTGPSRAIRLVDILSRGWEPAPAGFIARRSYYPWLVVGTTCIATFNGQLDASIVKRPDNIRNQETAVLRVDDDSFVRVEDL